LPTNTIASLAINGTHLFAGIYHGAVWKIALTDVIVSQPPISWTFS
jgi:hypothetical protein